MSRSKKKRFVELEAFSNAYDRDRAGPGGEWIRRHFGNNRPLSLELGCGKGEYTLALGRRFPLRNALGVDRKGDRLWKGARQALEEALRNVLFLRANIEDLRFYLDEGQVDSIWLPFPDPMPKRRQIKHRLLSGSFLALYRLILRPEGRVHLKTDDDALFRFALEAVSDFGGRVVSCIRDVRGAGPGDELLGVRTTFERRHLAEGRRIQYLSFRLGG